MLTQVNPTRILLAVGALYAYVLLRQYANGDWLLDSSGVARPVDFIGVWAAGHLALGGQPAAAYDAQQHGLAHAVALGQAANAYYPFPYPPFHLAIAAALACLSYIPAFLTWSAVTLAAYSWTAARILGSWRGAVWMAAAPAVLANIIVGQNGLYSAALLGLGLVKLERNPVAAGVFLGLLAYKPQIAALIPIALAAGGHWRAFVTAAVTSALLIAMSLVSFGPDSWTAFAAQLGAVGQFVSQQAVNAGKLQSLYGLLRQIGLSPGAAMAGQIMLALTLATGTAVVWRRQAPFALKAAWLATISLMASPYLFVYDLAVLMVAQAFFLRFALEEGLGEAEVWGVVGVNAAVGAVAFSGQPAGLLGCLAMMGLVLWRLPSLAGARTAVATA